MKEKKEVRLGIIGIGNMGSSHANNILSGKVPGIKLVAVSDGSEKRKDNFPDIPFYNEPGDLIASGKVDAVLIATPHYSHTTIGIQALEAGLHVLVEKPISVQKADCQRLVAAHKDSSKIFAAMFNQRTDPAYRKLKQLIDQGELGKIQRINWTITDWFRTDAYYQSGGWRATWAGEGGGVLLNQCPHQLDLWQWLFGMPESVRGFCQMGRFHDIEVEDDVTAYLRYPDGSNGVFITTTGEAPGTNRLEIAAQRGNIVLENSKILWRRNEVETDVFSRTSKSGFACPDTWNIEVPYQGSGEKHVGIMKNFANAILYGEELIAPAAEGINSVELCNAMLLSSIEDKEIVLPIDAEAYEKLLLKLVANSKVKKKLVTTKLADDGFDQSF